jgi:hypothetical protein
MLSSVCLFFVMNGDKPQGYRRFENVFEDPARLTGTAPMPLTETIV